VTFLYIFFTFGEKHIYVKEMINNMTMHFFSFLLSLPSAGPTFDAAKSRQKPSAQAPLGLAQRKLPLWMHNEIVAY